MKTWLRLYVDVVNDPKVQKLAGNLFKTWVNLLCVAAKNEGNLPDTEECAYCLRTTTGRTDKAIQELIEAGLIDRTETGLRPHNWDGRQYRSDVSTPRVQRFREKHRNVSETVNETPPDRADTETDTETEKTALIVPIISAPQPNGIKRPVPMKNSGRWGEFWKRYPHRVNEQLALQMWLSVVTPENETAVFACLGRYEKSDEWRRGIYQMPANWLSDRARNNWSDEPALAPGETPPEQPTQSDELLPVKCAYIKRARPGEAEEWINPVNTARVRWIERESGRQTMPRDELREWRKRAEAALPNCEKCQCRGYLEGGDYEHPKVCLCAWGRLQEAAA